MAKIQSKKDLLYRSRDGKYGKIVVKISEWKFELDNNRYVAKVDDYLSTIIDVDGVMIEQLTLIDSKLQIYPKVEIDTLFNYLNNSIEITETFSSELDDLISEALLLETQSRPIYESLDIDWELC
ncbi:hypothetical protein [Flavobacterium maritimum]|uniref:hypothetical protein n=1 Tax=Flavobacterium maritimum TaxID=3149042 RepID=UPI0032B4D2D6